MRPSNKHLCHPQQPELPAGAAKRPPGRVLRAGNMSRPFAGEFPPEAWRQQQQQQHQHARSVTGCGHHLPGTRNVFGLNYQQTLKTSEHVREMQRTQAAGGRDDAGLPRRLLDAWGNMKRSDILTTQHCANLYLQTLPGGADIDMRAGVGKPKGVPVVKEGTKPQRGRHWATTERVAVPPRAAGHTGHVPNKADHVGLGYNQMLMQVDPAYAAANNYIRRQPVADKVPCIPA